MLEKYSKEELWKIYEKLPQDLKGAIFSEETAESIDKICSRNNIENGKEISEVARYIGRVLLGLLSPDKLTEVLEKELKLKKEVAKETSQQIEKIIFYPVKASLENLYGTGTATPAEPAKTKLSPSKVERLEETFEAPEAPKTKKGPDTYREPIE
jgi:hypothetical protein